MNRPLFRRRTWWQRFLNAALLIVEAARLAPLRVAGAIVLMVILAALAGCSTSPQVQTVKTVVPVECREKEPDRPAMPTEGLAQGASLTDKVKAALAEILLREGYEGQLRTALRACIKPITKGSQP